MCGGMTPFCDTGAARQCVDGCTNDNMCGSGGTSFCDLATMSCVRCRTNADCGGGGGVCQPDHTCN